MSDITPLLITGPVKSGKTSALIREAKRFTVRGMTIISIKHTSDTRAHDHDGLMTSRDGTSMPIEHTVETLDYDELLGGREAPVVVAIDEGQFFGNSLVPFVDEAVLHNHRVIVAALNADFRRLPFECVSLLAARSRPVTLAAVCSACGNDAYHSKKIGGDKSKIIEVDSESVTYEPHCTRCFIHQN